MKQTNRFTKHIVSDIDYNLREPSTWDFPTLNVRVINKEGQGYILSSMKGNTEEFFLSDGFVAMGACEYNGVLYIVSYNPITEGSAVGSFPSPKQVVYENYSIVIDTTKSGFERVYKNLTNYYLSPSGVLIYMALTELNFELPYSNKQQIDIFPKECYDGSVDLYLADFYNFNKVINVGFDQKGICNYGIGTGRYYNVGQLAEETIQIKVVTDIPTIQLLSVETGGAHKGGNYYYYIRYLTDTFERSAFVGNVGPVQVFKGDDVFSIQGSSELTLTDKKVTLRVLNVNEAYTYIEVAAVQFYGINDSQLSDVNLISNYYTISGSELEITILGSEDKEILTSAEIIKGNIKYLTCKTHTQIDNRYFGGNWKGLDYNLDILTIFAGFITVTYDDSRMFNDSTAFNYLEQWGAGTIPNPTSAESSRFQYKTYRNTLTYTAYMRGEIYPFAIQGLLKDGSFTAAIPITGQDEFLYNGEQYKPSNSGLYRVPLEVQEGSSVGYTDYMNRRRVIGVKFDLTQAKTYYDTIPDSFNNIIGFKLVRGERLDNFLYQGLIMRCYHQMVFEGELNDVEQDNVMPLLNGSVPSMFLISKQKDPPEWRYDELIEPAVITPSDTSFALFSMDDVFNLNDKIDNSTDVFVKRIFKVDPVSPYVYTGDFLRPSTYGIDIVDDGLTINSQTNYDQVKLYNVERFAESGSFGGNYFRSKADIGDFYKQHAEGDNYPEQQNRPIYTPKYKGLAFENIISGDDEFIVNVYSNDPTTEDYYTDIAAAFNPSNTEYYDISEIFFLSSFPDELICYKGDTFPQRTYFRQMYFRYRDEAYSWEEDATSGRYFGHGLTIGMITENLINTAMRHEDSDHTFYPNLLNTVPGGSLAKFNGYEEEDIYIDESFLYNTGYHRVLSLGYSYGLNEAIPIVVENYITRILPSAKQIVGSINDAYSVFDITSYQDYSLADGPINKLEELNGMLVSVQDKTISQHSVNEQTLRSATTAGDLVIGTGSILSPSVRRLSDYGSQHQWSVKSGLRGLYGVDWDNSVIWLVTTTTTQVGTRVMQSLDLTMTKSIMKWMEEKKESVSLTSDITSKLDDFPISGNGIVTGYNKKYKEMIFTFHFDSNISYSLVFSELLDGFIGEASFTPGLYTNINDDLYTIKKNSNAFYRHDSNSLYNTFYGFLSPFQVSVIVNGQMDEGALIDEVKLFYNHRILGSAIDPTSIKWVTEYQQSTRNPFIDNDKFWDNPEYKEHKWHVPINLQDTSKENDYDTDSDIRGSWMKVTLEVLSADEVFIKSIETNFQQTYN